MARIFNTVISSRNPELLAEFWSATLDYNIVQRQDGLVRIAPPNDSSGPNLLFLRSTDVPERSVIHLDLAARDPAVEVRRLEQLGARLVDERGDDGSPVPRQANGIEWVVLADPEGNEFCVGSEPTP